MLPIDNSWELAPCPDGDFNPAILNLTAPVVFFPVRHHSPAGARFVQQIALELRPATILIEGPADFNPHMEQLYLPHRLPIAIYSYAQFTDGTRRGAFYPYCVYSPEWQALQMARTLNCAAQFIDLPWPEMAATAVSNHRYGEAELHQSRYVKTLGETLGIEGLDHLWDQLFEIDPNLTLTTYLERCHRFCFHCRVLDGCLSELDRQREAFMVQQIRRAMATSPGQILVVTGGYHSYALYAQVFDQPFDEPEPPAPWAQSEGQALGPPLGPHCPSVDRSPSHHGASLTPFSYERLDALRGYDAGMPSPGFYDQVWQDRQAGQHQTYQRLLTPVVATLRAQHQVISSADLIAVETMAQGLAALRGHAEVWRQDILDAITAALIKEALQTESPHPFLAAVQTVFRGQTQGELATVTALPPLVTHIKQVLREAHLYPQAQPSVIVLNLEEAQSVPKSQLLHQLRVLSIAGYTLTSDPNGLTHPDLATVHEEWVIAWSPAFEANCIEAAVYGCCLPEAAAARLTELAAAIAPKADQAARLLLDAGLMGLLDSVPHLCQQLSRLIQRDSDFLTVTGGLRHLLWLYRYDQVLGTAGRPDLGQLVQTTFTRGLWLLDSVGRIQGQDQPLLQGIKALLETVQRCHGLTLDRVGLIDICTRISGDPSQTPLLRGATLGALWVLADTPPSQLRDALQTVAQADRLGDFLTGLFCLAREVVQRNPDLLTLIDHLILAFDQETFLEALPALHLAFTYFTPREKYEIARTLVQTWTIAEGLEAAAPVPITPEVRARAQAIETQILATIEQYGLSRS